MMGRETHQRKRAIELGKENVSVSGFVDRNTPSLPTEVIRWGSSVPRSVWVYHRSLSIRKNRTCVRPLSQSHAWIPFRLRNMVRSKLWKLRSLREFSTPQQSEGSKTAYQYRCLVELRANLSTRSSETYASQGEQDRVTNVPFVSTSVISTNKW